MAKIIPFKGLRYNTEIVGDLSSVTTPPYDIISEKQQQEFYDMHPFNVIRLELGKELPDDDEAHNKYTRSGVTLTEWLESGVLKLEDDNSMYVYGQDFTLKNGKILSYKGIMCLVKLEEFEKGIVLPHEETLSKAKTDRYNLMSATGANFSAIYSLYLDEEKNITPVINEAAASDPDVSFKAYDGVVQKLWKISDDNVIKNLEKGFENKQLFIADGHHRYETALNYRNAMRAKYPDYTGNELFNYVMMFLVEMDEPGLVVFPTHRLVKNIYAFDETKVTEMLSDNFVIEKISAAENISDAIENKLAQNASYKVFAMYTGKDYYYYIKLKDIEIARMAIPDKSKAYQGLDVSILHNLILSRAFGIDAENMKDQRNLVYTRDPKEAENSVLSGDFQCAFFLNPTKIYEIKEVSLANEKMPQKSTYFYPKLITGLIMNKFQ